MELEDLKAACENAISNGKECIELVNRSVRLCGRRGPTGELLDEARGLKVVRYKAQAILDFLKRIEQ